MRWENHRSSTHNKHQSVHDYLPPPTPSPLIGLVKTPPVRTFTHVDLSVDHQQ